MVRMILTDLDHTLLRQDGSISDKTLRVLAECSRTHDRCISRRAWSLNCAGHFQFPGIWYDLWATAGRPPGCDIFPATIQEVQNASQLSV